MLPIPGTSSVKHLEENLAAASLQLSDEILVGPLLHLYAVADNLSLASEQVQPHLRWTVVGPPTDVGDSLRGGIAKDAILK